jgi:hypothetical protein
METAPDSGGLEDAMTRIARLLCALTLVMGVVSTATPAAAGPRAAYDDLAAVAAGWYGRLIELLGGVSQDRPARGGQATANEGPQSSEALCGGGSQPPEDGTCDQSEADNGPGIDPNG